MAKPNFTLPNKPAIKSGSILSYNYTDDFTFVPAPLTFNRDSAATRVNEKGLIEDVGYFGPELVQNGDFSEIGPELVTNGDFENGSASWTNASSDTFEVVNGGVGHNTSLHIVVSAINRGAYQSAFVSSKTYYISLDLKVVSGSVYIGKNTKKLNNQNYNNSDWQTITGYLTAIDDKIRIYGNEASEYYVDNVSVKEVGQNWTFGTGWSIDNGKAVKTSGTGSSLVQTVPTTTIGKKYKFTFDTIVTSGVANAALYGVTIPVFSTSGSQEHTIIATSTTGFNFFGDSLFEGSIDNISVIEVLGDKPRIDYSDSLTEPSLLLEPQSTNLLPYSEDFTKWILGPNSTLTYENNVIAPDGSLGVYRLQNPQTGSTFLSGGFINCRNFSLFVKAVTKGVNNQFNLDASGQPTDTKTATTKWQRFDRDFGTQANYNLSINNGIDNYASDIYIWGAQAEALSYATSYIPTSGSTVTRNADVCNNAGSSDLINSSEGVLYAEIAALSDDATYRLISISDGSNNKITLGYSNQNNALIAQIISGGSNVVNLEPINVSDITDFNKIAFSYKTNDCKVYVNGSLVATDTNAAMPTGLNQLNFDYAYTLDFYGRSRSVAVFKEALTDEELAKITSTTQQEAFYEMRDKMLQINADYYEFGDYTTRLKKLF